MLLDSLSSIRLKSWAEIGRSYALRWLLVRQERSALAFILLQSGHYEDLWLLFGAVSRNLFRSPGPPVR